MSPAKPPPPGPNAARALARHREQVSASKRADIDRALRTLRKKGQPISVAAVARTAGVSRKTVYAHPDVIATIDTYRSHGAAADVATQRGDSTIVAALRRQLAAAKAENKQLRSEMAEQKATIEMLYGQLNQVAATDRSQPQR